MTSTTTQQPAFNPAVRRQILGYKPRVPDGQWNRVKDFVVTAALEAQPASEKKGRELMLALTQLACWAENSAGLPLTTKTLLVPRTIQRFADSIDNQLNARLFRMRLLQVREALGGERTPRAPLNDATAEQPRPYANVDIRRFSTAIQAVRDPEARRNAMVMMGLAGGAGLRRDELSLLKVEDIQLRDTTYVVSVPGPHARTVAVRRDWAPYVRRGIKCMTPESEVFFPGGSQTTRNRRYRSLISTNEGNLPVLERPRMTWLTNLINTVPLGTFMHLGGYTRVHSITYFEALLEVMPEEELLPLLHGLN